MRSLVVAIALLLSTGSAHAQQTPTSELASVVGEKAAGYTAILLTARNGLLIADCTVQGIEFKMVLDTGTERASLDADISKPLKLKPTGTVTVTAIGGTVTGTIVDIRAMKIGGFDTAITTNSFDVVAEEGISKRLPYDGRLSLLTLGLFGGIIDYPTRTLYLRKPLTVAWPKLAGSWKAVSWTEDGAERQLQADSSPVFDFADERLKITDGKTTKEYAIDFIPDAEHDSIYFYDPKQSGLLNRKYLAGGLIKVDGESMTACFFLDLGKIKAIPTEFKADKGSGHVLVKLAQPGKKPPPPDAVKKTLVARGYTAVTMTRDSDGMIRVDGKHKTQDWPMLVDTGANGTCIDDALPKQANFKPAYQEKVSGAGGDVLAPVYHLTGYSFGRYSTQAHWQLVESTGIDLSPFNAERAKRKQVPLRGILGGQELLDGSAIIDLATNMLYLRPVKATIQPKLAGTWIVKASTAEGVRTVPADPQQTLTVNKDRMIFKGGSNPAEFGYHIRDEWDGYRFGLYDPKADVLAQDFTYTGTGIFQLDGDNLKLVRVIDPAKLKVANTEFAAPKGSGLVLLECTRKK